MHIEEDGSHTYSHTSLNLWRLCKRRWFYRYIFHDKEPISLQAAWSVHMVHRPVELTCGGEKPLSEEQWQICFEAFKTNIGEPDFEDNIHTVGAGKRIFEAVRKAPPGLSNVSSELEQRIRFSELTSYTSRPDLLGTRDGWRFTVDWKYTERAWKTVNAPWPLKPLLAYDDQLLGQAIAAKADGFIRGTIAVEPKTGKIAGPIYEERLVDGQLRKEWLAETKSTIEEIESLLWDLNWEGKHHEPAPWPKNTASCLAFGRECPYINLCKGGWNVRSRK